MTMIQIFIFQKCYWCTLMFNLKVPVNFGAFGFFLRDDDKCDAPGMGASIGSTDEDPATYKMQRPYIWENKGHNQSMEAG